LDDQVYDTLFNTVVEKSRPVVMETKVTEASGKEQSGVSSNTTDTVVAQLPKKVYRTRNPNQRNLEVWAFRRKSKM
jgi:hypothetical protein